MLRVNFKLRAGSFGELRTGSSAKPRTGPSTKLRTGIRRGDALFVMCLAEPAIDNLVDFHGANKDVDGPEKQVRGSIGVGGKAADPEPEQAYLTLQAVETYGVLKGVLLFLRKER